MAALTKTYILKLAAIVTIVVIIAHQYCRVPAIEEVVVLPLKHAEYVYRFSPHFEKYPGLFMSTVPATCLPPGTSTTQTAGRLGNVILEYASLWAMARLYNLTAFAPDEMYSRLSQVMTALISPSN